MQETHIVSFPTHISSKNAKNHGNYTASHKIRFPLAPFSASHLLTDSFENSGTYYTPTGRPPPGKINSRSLSKGKLVTWTNVTLRVLDSKGLWYCFRSALPHPLDSFIGSLRTAKWDLADVEEDSYRKSLETNDECISLGSHLIIALNMNRVFLQKSKKKVG